MAVTKVNVTLTPDEHRTLVRHLNKARDEQNALQRAGSDATPQQRRDAHIEYSKLTDLIGAL